MLNVFEEIGESGKIPFLVDINNNAHVFFKYKGHVVDMSELTLEETLNKKNREEC